MAGQVRRLTSAGEDIQFVSFDTPRPDLLVVLCGCRRACAGSEEYTSQARRRLIIAGESLNGSPQGEKQLASLIADAIGRTIENCLCEEPAGDAAIFHILRD